MLACVTLFPGVVKASICSPKASASAALNWRSLRSNSQLTFALSSSESGLLFTSAMSSFVARYPSWSAGAILAGAAGS